MRQLDQRRDHRWRECRASRPTGRRGSGLVVECGPRVERLLAAEPCRHRRQRLLLLLRQLTEAGKMVRLVPIVFLLPFAAAAVQTQPTLPGEEALFNAVRENMARANREQHRYAYKERRTEIHTNPFGRLGTGDVVLYDVTPGPAPAITYRKLLEKNGKPVAD